MAADNDDAFVDPYVYPGTSVLKNLHGKRTKEELERIEYRFTWARSELLARPDGTPVQARSEILSCEWDEGSVGILDTQTLAVRTWAPDQEAAREVYGALLSRRLS